VFNMATVSNSRKRTREEAFDEELFDNALKQMYENDEVEHPTKKKIRRHLQHKLNLSKESIRKHKQAIHSLMSKYWISPPKSGDDETSALPDHVVQCIFGLIHPRELFEIAPLVCRWWHHLLHKESTLRTLCVRSLRMTAEQMPSSVEVDTVIPWIKKSCRRCATVHTLRDARCLNMFKELKEFKEMICWMTPLCSHCFEHNHNLQGIYWVTARTRYELTDCDLYCCRVMDLGYKYVNHADVIEVAKDKYGDISSINTLTALRKATINRERRRAYGALICILKVELEEYLEELEVELQSNASLSGLTVNEMKSEMDTFLVNHHDGYAFFIGAHDRDIAINFNRKVLHYAKDLNDIKQMLREHMNDVSRRRLQIRNMSRKDVQSELYAASWMDGRFGGSTY